MRSKSGFTIVEVIVVVVIIAILAGVSILTYQKVQVDAQNTSRKAVSNIVADSLEKYYAKNGEYPSVRSLANNFAENTGTSISTKLNVNKNDLVMPTMPGTATNALTSTPTPTNDYISYIGKSDTGDSDCQSLSTGGCEEFTLKYIEAGTGKLIIIESRHKAYSSTLVIPNKPVLTATRINTTVTATATADACDGTAMFTFRYRTNAGAWSAYNTWATATALSIPGTPGSTYDFQAMTRCDRSSAGPSSPESDIVSYVYPADVPPGPATTVALSGANVLATASVVTCPVGGATTQYAIRSRTNDGVWTSYSGWSTTRTSSQVAAQGVKYEYQAKARCQSGATFSGETEGSPGTYTHPIAAPAAPAVSVTTNGLTSTWTWVAVACPSGATARYQYNTVIDSGYVSSWGSTNNPAPVNETTEAQGYQYTVQVQAQCYNTYASSGWGALGSANYIRPVDPPFNVSWYAYKTGARIINMQIYASCGPGVGLFSYFEERSDTYAWTTGPRAGSTGWYGAWRLNGNYYGSPVSGGTQNQVDISSSATYGAQSNLRCKNSTTGRESGNTTYTSQTWSFGSLPNG